MVLQSPIHGIKFGKTGEYQPWPEKTLEHFLENAEPDMRDAAMLAVYTGQRRGDVIAMRWSDIDDDMIRVTQQKTGARLAIPIHPDLADHLPKIQKNAITILSTPIGRQWGANTFAKRFKAETDRLGITGLVFHGFRKTATVRLAEAGCSTELIKAITGHTTDAMISYYAKGANQERLARKAIAKLVPNNAKKQGKP
ncbi:MAG: tyrosine-type recombinase/integrase [Magnetospiraceae bacterium]